MAKSQRAVLLLLSFVSLVGGVAWQFHEPGFEPWLFVVGGLVGFFTVWWPKYTPSYRTRRLKGRVTFDYSSNNGRYSIGEGDLTFETAWSKASDDSIHIYNDPPSIKSLALVQGIANICEIKSSTGYDFSSRSQTPEEGDIVILKNKYGNSAVLKVIDIKDSSRSDTTDEITFEYVISTGPSAEFKDT